MGADLHPFGSQRLIPAGAYPFLQPHWREYAELEDNGLACIGQQTISVAVQKNSMYAKELSVAAIEDRVTLLQIFPLHIRASVLL